MNLRAERLNKGLSLTAAADAMDVPLNVLSRAEAADGKPHPANAKKIADFYGCRVTDLWPINDDPPPVEVGRVRKVPS